MRPAVHGRLAVVAAGVLLIASACGAETGSPEPSPADSPGSSPAGEPIPIGALNPVTGAGSAYGEGIATAIRIAAEEVNDAGGPLGRPFEVTYEDSATDPDTGVRAATRLLEVNNVRAILGTWASSVTLAVAPLTIDANAIQMNSSGNPDISTLDDNDTVFRVGGTDLIQATIMARRAYADGYRQITIMSNNQAGTIGMAESFRDVFEEQGGEVLEFIEYADAQTSYRSEVERALNSEPDLILLACYTPDATVILREAFEAGADTDWMAQAFCVNSQVVDALGPEAVEGIQVFDLVPDQEAEAYRNLAEKYQDATGQDVFENIYAVHAYDMVHLLALGIEKAGTTDGDAVGRAMLEISNAPGESVFSFADGVEILRDGGDVDYEGASGPIDFDENGDISPVLGIFVFEDGSPVLQGQAALEE